MKQEIVCEEINNGWRYGNYMEMKNDMEIEN